jgi:tetratricopeptide (TPR) repeat protein
MSDSNGSNKGLGTFLSQISTPILAGISLISGVYGFVKLFADKDAGLVTLISLTVGILLLLGVCLYYARFWQPERQDQGQSAFSFTSDEQGQAQAKKERLRQWIRRLAVAGLILIPVLSISGIAGWFYVQSLPPKNVIVLVVEFDGPDAKTYGVTEEVIRQLREATKPYTDVEIQALNKPITEQEGSKAAQTEGGKRKATIVIWGWYRNPGEVVPLSVHFEVLRPPKELPAEMGQATAGRTPPAPMADLKNFSLQSRLSNEMTYLSMFVLGMTRRAAGDGKGAIARFSDALGQTTEPSSRLNQSVVYFYRGSTYLFEGDADRALADLNQAITLQPALAEAYANRTVIYLAKGDYSRALADANQVLNQQPDLAVAYNNRGLIYLQTNDYDRAIADFDQTLKLLVNDKDDSDASNAIRPDGSQLGAVNPSDREFTAVNFFYTELSDYLVYVNRGIAYLWKGDSERALTDLNQAIKLRPERFPAYFNRATVYGVRQEYDRTLADLNQVIRLQPDFALAYLKRGSVYHSKGDPDRALADYDQALRLQPDFAPAYLIRCELYQKKEDYERAITDCTQALKLQPDAATYHARGAAYALKGDYVRALADYDQALKLKPSFDVAVAVYRNRGAAYNGKGDYNGAVANYNEHLKLQPNDARAYNGRGWAYAQIGDFKRALADVNQALTLKPDEANFYDSRGFAYAGTGDYDRAIADYNQALKLKPDADYAYYHRGIVYRALGDYQKASADFKKTLELTKNSKRRQDAEKQLQEIGIIQLKK